MDELEDVLRDIENMTEQEKNVVIKGNAFIDEVASRSPKEIRELFSIFYPACMNLLIMIARDKNCGEQFIGKFCDMNPVHVLLEAEIRRFGHSTQCDGKCGEKRRS